MVRLTDLGDFLSKGDDSDSSGERSSISSLLVNAIHLSGPNTYRNAATFGGIVASRLSDSELLAALLVLDTELMVYAPEQISINIVDYLASEHRPNGLIAQLKIPWHVGTSRSERVARTPADYPIVSVTYFRTDDGDSRLAATGIDHSPIRLEAAEEALNSGANIDVVAQAAKDRARHPGDFRGTSQYRAQMAFVLTRRVLSSSGE
jgi:carbon-monoxide dehydrogenase medium subunit